MPLFRRERPRPDPSLSDTVIISADHLRILNRVLQATRGPYEVPQLLELLVREIVDAVGARWGTIKLRGVGGEDVARTMIRTPGLHAGTVPRVIENTAFLLVSGSREPLVVDELGSDSRFPPPKRPEEAARCLLAVPILHQGDLAGVLTLVDRREGGVFLKYHSDLAQLLAAEAGSLLENARLLEDALQHRALDRERELAESVWRRFLPARLPEVPGFALAAACNPARQIGGDYYDVLRLPDGRTIVALGDVSGSGMPAALLMSNLQALLRMSLRVHAELVPAILLVNEHLCAATGPEHFATLFLGILEEAGCRFRYVNAGHNPPYILGRDGSVRELAATGIPLGFLTDAVFEAGEETLGPGDRILIFSDGLVEAADPDEELFGEQRLLGLMHTLGEENPAEQVQRLLREVERWSAGSEGYQDDRTVVLLTTCPQPGGSAPSPAPPGR
jgi:serine phosphatase RsbU (regulator of sigma subunit)